MNEQSLTYRYLSLCAQPDLIAEIAPAGVSTSPATQAQLILLAALIEADNSDRIGYLADSFYMTRETAELEINKFSD